MSAYKLSQTMLRIKDPEVSVAFYRDVLQMQLIDRYDFPENKFSLYFMGYPATTAPEDPAERVEFTFDQPGFLELTHNWGTESDAGFAYHNGNTDPRGFGHIGITVPDVAAAFAEMERHGVDVVKRPDDGSMKGLAFIKDPDGYWIEILCARTMRDMITARRGR